MRTQFAPSGPDGANNALPLVRSVILSLKVMSPRSKRNTVLVVSAIAGFAVTTLFSGASDPMRPYLLLVGGLIVLKVNLEYMLGLPIGVTYPFAMPEERGRRYRVLIASWFIILLMIYGALAW